MSLRLLQIKQRMKASMPTTFRIIKRIARSVGVRGLGFTRKVDDEDLFVTPDFGLDQFFFRASTAKHIVSQFDGYNSICCVSTPRLAAEWAKRGKNVVLLDVDERFGDIPGYRYFDLRSPVGMHGVFDLIVVDPPFFLSAVEVRRAIDAIASHGEGLRLCVFFPLEREGELMSAFEGWSLQRIRLENIAWNNLRGAYNDLNGVYSNRPIVRDDVAAPSTTHIK